jgi:hypothetical protein
MQLLEREKCMEFGGFIASHLSTTCGKSETLLHRVQTLSRCEIPGVMDSGVGKELWERRTIEFCGVMLRGDT